MPKKPVKDTSLANLKPFKKGEDERRNLNGRPKRFLTLLKSGTDPEERLTYDDVRAVVEVQMKMTEEELKKIVLSDTGAAFEKVIAHSILKDISRGSLYNMEILLSRLYGKPDAKIDLNVNTTEMVTYHLPVPDLKEMKRIKDIEEAQIVESIRIGNGNPSI